MLEPRILSWFASEELPFLSEVVDRTEADRKGGHLARRRDGGGLVLRETAQVPEEDQDAFEDVERHRFFNANNIWVNLRALERTLEERDGILGLPMIVNRKTVDPDRPLVPRGRAARDRDGRGDRRVRRRRGGARAAAALHAGEDHERSAGGALGCVRAGGRLDDPAHPGARGGAAREAVDEFKLLRDFEERFPAGAPSLRGAEQLEVEGDVRFGADVVVRGRVRVEGPASIPDGTVLEGSAYSSGEGRCIWICPG